MYTKKTEGNKINSYDKKNMYISFVVNRTIVNIVIVIIKTTVYILFIIILL